MTQRLTDDEIKAFRSHQQALLDELRGYARGNDWPDKSYPALGLRLLDEIEERRRNDAEMEARLEKATREDEIEERRLAERAGLTVDHYRTSGKDGGA